MQALFKTTADVKKTVKVNASLPFESLAPYLDDAYELYILPYVGERLMAKLLQNPNSRAMELARRALGPLAVAMASPELGIALGDTGHTVVNTDKVAVASDNKIQKSEESMDERGWRNLELLLELFSSDITNFPEWTDSRYYKLCSTGHFFNSAQEFQDFGKVDIRYSRLTFEKLRPVLERYELTLRKRLTITIQERLLKLEVDDAKGAELLEYVRLWLASTVASVFSGQTTRQQRATPGKPEFKPVFYPLFQDVTGTGSFYAEQSAYWDSIITDFLAENAAELGLAPGVIMDFNSKDKHIFST